MTCRRECGDGCGVVKYDVRTATAMKTGTTSTAIADALLAAAVSDCSITSTVHGSQFLPKGSLTVYPQQKVCGRAVGV